MRHYVHREAGEEEITLAKLKDGVADQTLPPHTLVRREGQDFHYPAAQLLGLEPIKPLAFICPACQHQVQSTGIDMQLPVVCASCGATVMVPDRRSPVERQQSRMLNLSRSTANMKIAQGLLLCGCAMGILLLGFGDWKLSALLPAILGLTGLSFVFTGVSARKRIENES